MELQVQDPRKSGRNIREFGSLTPAAWKDPGLNQGRVKKFLAENKGFGSLRTLKRAGRPATGTYPQVIHKKFMYGEFGSLKVLDIDLGSRAFHGITRSLDPRYFGPGPWFCSHETI